jgi:uncharacterized coiled-coil DUF342 family protein
VDAREILAMADERFERRLTEESAAIQQEIAALRSEMATRADMQAVREELAALRGVVVTHQEINAIHQTMATRQEINAILETMATRQGVTELRHEMNSGFTRLERELATTRVEMIKWSFMFWTGQCLAILGFLFVFLRNR